MNIQPLAETANQPFIPAREGFFFPAEWHPHVATWLSWPHTEASWTKERQELMFPAYIDFIKAIAESEQVCINAHNDIVIQAAKLRLLATGADMSRITLLPHPTNDSWCRDHGPAFLINPEKKERIIVNWGYNAWGGKYPPYDRDDLIPWGNCPLSGAGVCHTGNHYGRRIGGIQRSRNRADQPGLPP